MMRSSQNVFFNISIAAVVIFVLTDCKVLDDYIKHYEELHYDADTVHKTHNRHKRSADYVLQLPLEAFGRKLHLELKKDSSAFTDGYQTELSDGTLKNVDLSFLYSGTVNGIPGGYCHGSIIQGVFQGTIHLPDEVYHVQKSRHFFDNQPVFHSVIYRESDMDLDPYRVQRTRERREARELGTCGYDSALEWMREVQRSEVKDNRRFSRSTQDWKVTHSGTHNQYSADKYEPAPNHRVKRQKLEGLGSHSICAMELRSDPVFWDRYMNITSNNSELARDEILAFFHSHIRAINHIYGKTLFKTYDGMLGIGFVKFAIKRTKIYTRENDCSPTATSTYCNDDIDIGNLLNQNSLENHDGFCLSFMFTNRDFAYGTLGLAWTGASDESSGGLCEKYKTFEVNGQKVKRSLNTGVVTTKTYSKQVPSKVSQLTFAHEIGHSLGSPHDSGEDCVPYGTSQTNASDGNYLMFGGATKGDKPHNSEFSPCSKDNITRFLDVLLKGLYNKWYCLQDKSSFCGNSIVEDGEDCDCGFEDQCDDQCCHPKKIIDADDPLACTRKNGVVCSPSEGPCCTSGCSFVSLSQNQTCKYAQDCYEAAYCSGNNASCPEPVKKGDGTFCNNYGFTCKTGECGGSLCERFGWTECFIQAEGDITQKEEQERLCTLACESSHTGCIISSEAQVENFPAYKQMIIDVRTHRARLNITDPSPAEVALAAGSPCNNYQGYCDESHRCRTVAAEEPLINPSLKPDPTTERINNCLSLQAHLMTILITLAVNVVKLL